VSNEPLFDRFVERPNKYTFGIVAVRDFLRLHMDGGMWADPFAGCLSPAQLTNDIDPSVPSKYHMDAREFALSLPDGSLDGVLFDPPYSPRQISECYSALGRTVTMRDTQNALLYASVRNALIPKIRTGGKVVRCGWSSTGFGAAKGFELLHVRLVCHGAGRNDTIVTCERKLSPSNLELFAA
jgi:hypothetical protein